MVEAPPTLPSEPVVPEVQPERKHLLDPDKPLWMPDGSVRAMLTFGIIGSFLGASIFVLLGYAPEVPGALSGMAATAFGYYFAQRSGSGNT